MQNILHEMSQMVKEFGSAPAMAEMPRRTLADKGICGPTAAHVIEEIHTPFNLAYVTFTTGTTAFQNIVGVTFNELPQRAMVAQKIWQRTGLQPGDKILVTYPPLINVFSGQAMKESGLEWAFLYRSSRDAFFAALYDEKPAAVLGESSFLRAILEDAKRLGVVNELPQGLTLLTAGTPLDLELLPLAQEVFQVRVHDLYGCQEFGWAALDGVPLRDDVVLLPSLSDPNLAEIVVGGLPTGDCVPVSESGHVCDAAGKIITYRRQRSSGLEVVVRETGVASRLTIERAARSILRIKGCVVRIAPQLVTRAEQTVLQLIPDPLRYPGAAGWEIRGPVQTRLFDDLVQAQVDYQKNGKADPVWKK
jgi:ACP-SH:acetate ligase